MFVFYNKAQIFQIVFKNNSSFFKSRSLCYIKFRNNIVIRLQISIKSKVY